MLIPATILTGFLGSGKTTLLKRVLTEAHGQKIAIIENEFGEENIDNEILVSDTNEQIIQMNNGCVCCSIREDLRTTLQLLAAKKRKGLLDFERVVIETTGLADPGPVAQTFFMDDEIAESYLLDSILTLVDAKHAAQQLNDRQEARRQVGFADQMFISKSDLASADTLTQLRQRLSELNPLASQGLVVQGDLSPNELIGLGLASARASDHTLRFLGESLEASAGGDASPGRYLGERQPRHDPSLRTLSLRFQTPFAWPAFSSALDLLTQMRGPDLLRVKGIVNVQGKPVVVQGVQHLFHPPVELDRWPSDDRDSRLVFITRHIEADVIRRLFDVVGQLGLGTAQPVAPAPVD